jgi:hypothetical protein
VRRLAPWVIVAAALVYPAAVLVANGAPSFPTRDDCVRPATEGRPIEAVFGRFESEWKARELRDRALAVGFPGTEAMRDACGRMKVFLPGIPTLEVGREFVDQAREAGFEVTLAQAG